MKRLSILLLCALTLSLWPSTRANAQIEVIEEVIKAVIMAADLAVQKLQTATITLQEVQKQAENLMEKTQLADITDWVQQQKDLFSEYYQELWKVKDALSSYQKLVGLIDKQVQLVQDCQRANALFQKDSHFSPTELTHIGNVYAGILKQSIDNVNNLALVINSFMLQMSDGERLQLINGAGERIDKNYTDLKTYTQQNILISTQRAKDQQDLDQIRSLYGIIE